MEERKEIDMVAILQFEDTKSTIGLRARKPRNGPEWELVQTFREQIVTIFEKQSAGIAIFYEPLLETGFPDMVVAEFDPRLFENWPEIRSSLQLIDLKVLQHIYWTGCTSNQMIASQLGIDGELLQYILDRLHNTGLIKWYSKKWKPSRLSHVFGIKRLVAIEAKIKNWESVFYQAQVNKWFASESYVLLPIERPTAKILQQAEKSGVGIYCCSHSGLQQVYPSPRLPLPSSYVSWLFNEWIGRYLNSSVGLEGKNVYTGHTIHN